MREDINQDLSPAQKKRQRQKRKIKKQILIVQWFFVLLFIVMGVYICTYSIRYKKELFENDYNGLEEKQLSQIKRGSIYASDGSILAQTVENSDGTETRQYPYGREFAHVVGYTSQGGSGLENDYNYEMVQSDLSLSEKASLDNQGKKYYGNDVYTTLDPVIQEAAYEALGAYKGAIIVSDPKTGDILAMVSKPDFDPGTIDEDWAGYLEEDSSVGTLLNRVTQGAYPPGSTFKIIDAIEYLEEHPDDWDNFSFDCTGDYIVDNVKIHCFHYEVHGEQDLRTAFANSCNCAFSYIGLQLDKSHWNQTMTTLMFNGDLPYDYTYNKSKVTLKNDTDTQETMQVAIGEGETSMSPLHMNLITNAVANGGILMKPRLVSAIKTGSGNTLETISTSEYGRLMDENVADEVIEMMRAVVTEGTATKLDGYYYVAAGKTGSAEFDASDETKSHAWFSGLAPYDDPKVTVTVIVEGAGSGGDYAVPMARQVFDAYFREYPLAASYGTATPETEENVPVAGEVTETTVTENTADDALTEETADDAAAIETGVTGEGEGMDQTQTETAVPDSNAAIAPDTAAPAAENPAQEVPAVDPNAINDEEAADAEANAIINTTDGNQTADQGGETAVDPNQSNAAVPDVQQ